MVISEESSKKKKSTAADMYFVPFDRMQLSEFFPIKFFMDDKEVPLNFHLLDTFEPASNIRLEPGKHLFCVYGDNWLQDVKYSVQVLIAESGSSKVSEIQELEKTLKQKKEVMTQFQTEFMDAKKK